MAARALAISWVMSLRMLAAVSGLVFITLPSVFGMAFHAVPWLGYVFSGLFYILLLLAALTSAMSLHESVTAYVYEGFHISRRMASLLVSVSSMCLGVLCCLSFGPLSGWTLGGMTVFDLFDFVSSKVILPLGGLLLVLFTGWYLDRGLIRDEITNRGELPVRMFGVFMFLVRWVAPLAIAVIIKGYASPEGSAEINAKIANARAVAVRDILVNKYKIAANRISAEGQGVGNMFSEPDWNRVSICTLDESK